MSRKHPGSRHHAALNQRRWQQVRRQALERDGWRCAKCGKASSFEVDHIRPLRNGGAPYDLANLQTLCRRPCHLNKTLAESGHAPGPRAQAWGRLVQELTHAI